MTSSHREFSALVVAVAHARDQQAFARLFDHFAPRLRASLQRAGADPALAEEVAQDTMVTLWRKAPLFNPVKSSVTTWLHRIAHNRRVDLIRRRRTERLDPAPPPGDLPDAVDLDRHVDVQQREEAVHRALTRLPGEQLALVRLAYFEGLSHAQIAERTGLPLGTVKSRIRLAVSRLRRALEANGVAAAG